MTDHTRQHLNHGDTTDVTRLALRPRDAAKALGIGERKLWEITADQTSGIPHVRFGKAIVYPTRELADWLAAQVTKQGGSGERRSQSPQK